MPVVIVNGMPGAGKTTLARDLSRRTGLLFLSLDEVKEAMADVFGVYPPDETEAMGWSTDLSHAAFTAILALVPDAKGGAVLDVMVMPGFRRVFEDMLRRSGLGPDDLHEVWCELPFALSQERFAARASSRHPIHIERRRADEHRDVFDETWTKHIASLEPMGLGPVHRVDSTEPVDVAEVARMVGLGDRQPAGNPVVLVNGLPGAGKTTIAREICERLRVPLFSIDALKEPVADVLDRYSATVDGPGEWSGLIGRVAMQVIWTLLGETTAGAVLEAPFSEMPESEVIENLRAACVDPAQVHEVWCDVPGATAWQRFVDRAPSRHPVHIERGIADAGKLEFSPHWQRLIDQARPLGLGPVHRIDTTRPVDIDTLIAEIRPHAAAVEGTARPGSTA